MHKLAHGVISDLVNMLSMDSLIGVSAAKERYVPSSRSENQCSLMWIFSVTKLLHPLRTGGVACL